MEKEVRLKVFSSTDYKVLTKTERTVFREVVNTLVEQGLFKPADVPVIAAYARNVVLARVAAQDIQKMGTVIAFEDRGCKKWKTNPAVTIMDKAQSAYEATAIKLGLTPTGRKRLKDESSVKSASDAWDEQED